MVQGLRFKMGKVRLPRPDYFKGGVIEFFTVDNIPNYRCKLWTNDGSHTFEFSKGSYQNNNAEIIKLAQANIEIDISKAGNKSVFWMAEKESQSKSTVIKN